MKPYFEEDGITHLAGMEVCCNCKRPMRALESEDALLCRKCNLYYCGVGCYKLHVCPILEKNDRNAESALSGTRLKQ